MKWTLQAPQLSDYEHVTFDLSWGTDWEVVGKKPFSARRAARRLKLAAGLARRAAELSPSLVHFHCGSGGRWDFLGDMILLAAARFGGGPILFHWHRDTETAVYPGTKRLTRGVFLKSAGTAEGLAVLLEGYRPPLQRIGLGHKVHVLPNTFDPALLNLPPRGGHSDRVQVAFIGRLSGEKGFPDLLNAIQRWQSSGLGTPIHFSIAGAADPAAGGLAGIRRHLEEIGIGDHVTLLGPVGGGEKAELLARADLFVLPSHRESFGIAALEAMAAGLPVVAYDVGHLREILGPAGVFVPAGNVEELASSLGELAADPARRQEMGAAGRERARRDFSPAEVGSTLREVYEELIASRERTG